MCGNHEYAVERADEARLDVGQLDRLEHLDCKTPLALVHEGVLANGAELRVALARAGHRIRSQTDSELIAHLIEDLLEQTPAGPEQLKRATAAALRKVRGLHSILVLDVRSGRLAAAESGSAAQG